MEQYKIVLTCEVVDNDDLQSLIKALAFIDRVKAIDVKTVD